MNKNSRVFQNKKNQVTQIYKKDTHKGIDMVAYKSDFDYITAHSAGEVVGVRKDYNKTDSSGNSYGNYVKIKHANGYYTLYAHLKYNSVTVKVGDKVSQGQVIGYMGATGHCTGAHVHFEVRNASDVRIDPTPYINADLPGSKPEPAPTPTPAPAPSTGLKVGDKVRIVKTGKASSYGSGLTAGGKGWVRYITKIYVGRPYPYQVGLKGNTSGTATTGFYKADALEKID